MDTGGPGGQSALETTCMMPACTLVVGEDVFLEALHAAPAHQAQFCRLQGLAFVDECGELAWCPARGCGNVVAYSTRKRTVVCGAGHRFCFACQVRLATSKSFQLTATVHPGRTKNLIS